MKIGDIDTASITDAQKLKEVEREIAYRWKVFGKLVANRKMTSAAMHQRIAIMIAIRDEYRERVAYAEASKGKLL